jgi:hypothetical protein
VKTLKVKDREKLVHLLGYLQRTREQNLILRLQKVFKIEAYVDASFAIYMDGKSHSGAMMMKLEFLCFVEEKMR